MRLIGTLFLALSMGFLVYALAAQSNDIIQWAYIMAGGCALPGMIFRYVGEYRYKRKLLDKINESIAKHEKNGQQK